MTKVIVERFSLTNQEWSVGEEVIFEMEDKPFAEGAFRLAYKARSSHPDYKGKLWVLKKLNKHALDTVENLGESAEAHTRKSVQMNCLATFMVKAFNNEINVKISNFGETFSYNPVFYGKIIDEHVTIEEYIEGSFKKYVNNDGNICDEFSDMREKAETFVHFTFQKSKTKLMITDIQGVGMVLCDPEIATTELSDDQNEGEMYFCIGNLSIHAIQQFKSNHVCNKYCDDLGFESFEPEN